MNTKYIIGAIVAIIVVLIGGALLMGGGTTERGPGEIVVAAYSHGGEPEAGFDPIAGWNYYAEPLIQSTLLKMNTNGTYSNDLATDYEISSDFKKYTVNIRDDVNFTDGTPLTAEDVAFTFNAARDSGASLDLTALKEAKAVDDYTVEFDLNKSDSTFLDKLAYIGIVPSDSYDNETYGENPVGSGPYNSVQWDKGQQVILEKNPDYYGKMPEVEKITILFAQNEAAFNLAKNGEADVVAVPLEYGKESVDGYTMYLMDTIDVRGISLPSVPDTGEVSEGDNYTIGNNVTSDIAVRKALNYGINRTALAEGALNGLGVPCYDGIAHQLPWANPEAAIEDGDVAYEVYYSANAPERQALALGLAEQAKEFGIEVEPIGAEWDEIYPNEYSQGVLWGYGSTDPSDMYGEYYSSSDFNPASVNNSAVDAHMDAAFAESREASYKDWSAVSWDGSTGISPKGDANWLWLGEIKYGYFVHDRVDISNDTALLQPHGGDLFSNIYDWTMTNATSES